MGGEIWTAKALGNNVEMRKSMLARKLKFAILFTSLTLCPFEVLMAQDYDSLIEQARTLQSNGDLAGAEDLLRIALEIPEDKSEVATLLGLNIAFQERYDEGLTMIESELAKQPQQQDLRIALARINYFKRNYTIALSNLDLVLAINDRNLEALLLSGQVAMAVPNPELAEQRFLVYLEQAPEDIDALVALHDALVLQSKITEARQKLALAENIDPDSPLVTQRIGQVLPDRPGVSVISGFSNNNIDLPEFPVWQDRFLELRNRNSNGNQQYFRIEHNHRFNDHNTMMEAGFSLTQSNNFSADFSAGYTRDATFMADYFGTLGLRRLVMEKEGKGALVLTGLYKYNEFSNGNTNNIQLGMEYYLPGINAWLTPAIGMVQDQDGIETFSWTLAGNWQIRPRTRIGLSYSEAPETENLVTTDTINSTLYWRYNLGDPWVIYLYLSRWERENSYTRESASLSFQYRL